MSFRIEPEFKDTYMEWHKNPAPETNVKLLGQISPVLDKGIRMYGSGSALDKSKAKELAMQAMSTYDPTRSKLQSHLLNHMKGLQRYGNKPVLKVPERDAIVIQSLKKNMAELEDSLGREPTEVELSDYVKISPEKLVKLRKKMEYQTTGGLDMQVENHANASRIPGDNSEQDAWVSFILPDLSPIDQQILTYTLGLSGKPKLSNTQIAAKVRLSPGAISQRKQKIQQILDRQEELSPWG